MKMTAVTIVYVSDINRLDMAAPEPLDPDLVGHWEVSSVTAIDGNRVLIHWCWWNGWQVNEKLSHLSDAAAALLGGLEEFFGEPPEAAPWVWDQMNAWAKKLREAKKRKER